MRRKPIAVTLDRKTEALLDTFDRLLEQCDEYQHWFDDAPMNIEAAQRALFDYRRAWIIEQTARAR
ncbi:MAG: hypothetical protein NUW01_12745 [Gemmatimonadaceae bacterium]|nr:hypothetical protein [Gemmatimonadaceae bacterium]